MYCPNCGKENDNDWKFCKWCGKQLGNVPVHPQPSPKNIIVIAILAVVAAIAFFALAVMFLSGGKDAGFGKGLRAETSSKDGEESRKTASADKEAPLEEESDPAGDSLEVQEEASLYAAEYGQILREYLDGKRGVSYGSDMEFDNLHLHYGTKVGLNPQTGRFEYYFALYDANQDGQDELYVSSCPAWWGNSYIAEGIYSYIQGNLVISLDRSGMSEYNNYYSFVKDMNVKIEERSGGSWHSYKTLNSQGMLEDVLSIWWGVNGNIQVNGQEAAEGEANSQDALYNQPPQIQWQPVTEDNIRKYFAAPQDGRQIPSRPEAPSKAAISPYEEDMDRLSFWGSSWQGSPFTVEDRGDYYEASTVSVYRELYLDAELVKGLQPGDALVFRGETFTLRSIEAQENSYFSAPCYSISLDGPQNEIHSLYPTEDGNHYIVVESSDDPLLEEIYTGSVWIRKDASIMGVHPVTYEIGTYPVTEYLDAMKRANNGNMYLSIMRFRTDKDGYIILMEGQIAG